MNPQSILMTVLWLAALGAVIVVGGRVVSNLQSKAGV